MIQVYCKNTGTSKSFVEGTSLLEMLSEFGIESPYPFVSAKVNNVSEGLKYRAYNCKDVEFLTYQSYAGRSAYCRSLVMLLGKAVKDAIPGATVSVRRPISKGFFCSLKKKDGGPTTPEDVKAVAARMREIVEAASPFYRHEVRTEDAVKLFTNLGYDDRVDLLETCDDIYITYYTLEGTPDYFYDALVPDAGYLKVWDLIPYQGGMLLRVPDRHDPDRLAPFKEEPKTFDVMRESVRWNEIMDLNSVGDVNKACLRGEASDLIQVSEALQDKKLVQIAEDITRRARAEVNPVKVVLITGPSSSGKSTVCKKLSVQLKACGLRPVFFSTDDYFVNRLDTPRLPDGSFDFDGFDTVDHALLEKDVVKLLAGETVSLPEYNFVTGLREYNGKNVKLEKDSVLMIEGIHALNPGLIPSVDTSCQYRIFINTITSISLDDHNCIPTSDNRLLRRIIRDYNKGAFTARETISNWPNVRRAESKWIYPYVETADVLYNSAYLIEFAVLRTHAEAVLSTVPKNCPEYGEAHRLLKFLHYYVPVSSSEIPSTSLLRDFVG
ncbi:MAG: nucleoside kinase [Bacteroidales bacterium]|nr:nucleoside kinase [Bacteroidales bacterium]